MKQKLVYTLFFGLFLLACSEKKAETFSDFVEIDDIERVRMSNNSGTFYLSEKQLISFKNDLKSLTYEPGIILKTGAIHIELTIHGKSHSLSSSTHGEYVEAYSSIASKNKEQFEANSPVYFKTNGVNFDNYKKEK